jgi:hypothetical protein
LLQIIEDSTRQRLAAQTAQFERDGFIVLMNVLEPETVSRLVDAPRAVQGVVR